MKMQQKLPSTSSPSPCIPTIFLPLAICRQSHSSPSQYPSHFPQTVQQRAGRPNNSNASPLSRHLAGSHVPTCLRLGARHVAHVMCCVGRRRHDGFRQQLIASHFTGSARSKPPPRDSRVPTTAMSRQNTPW